MHIMKKSKSQKIMESAGFQLTDIIQSDRYLDRKSEKYKSDCGRWTIIWSLNPISEDHPNFFVFDSAMFDLDFNITAPMQGDCILQTRITESKIKQLLKIILKKQSDLKKILILAKQTKTNIMELDKDLIKLMTKAISLDGIIYDLTFPN